MSAEESVRALVNLGFTGLEAEVYTALAQHPPMTGYRVAQVLGKPAANVYKAIESLQSKGAVIVDDGANRVCHAVPADELLGLLERGFRESRERAATALAELQSVTADDRVYQLRSREQVLERCRRMLARAERVALLDAFPAPLEELRAELEAAAARGVTVAVKAYEPTSLREAEVFVHPDGRAVIDRWPGQWVNVVVDGREHLLALLTRDGTGVHQAVSSESSYLSWVYHSAVAGELILADVQKRIAEGASSKELRGSVERYRRIVASDAPGFQQLLRRFGARPAGPKS
ncbi:MAG TPA: helix-turn-helix domain-containing protein [Pyrinomonadaceae bacterium]